MLVFFGTSPRSAKFLEKVIQNGLKVDLIVSDPPKPVGKKQILTENPVVTLAQKLNITNQTSSFQFPASATLGLIFDYQRIIPNNIIDQFPKGIINVHFSKLPQYRGPAPVQYAILNGDKEAWITYFLINDKLDSGPIIAQTSIPLDQTETTEDLYQKLIEKCAKEVVSVINEYLNEAGGAKRGHRPSARSEVSTGGGAASDRTRDISYTKKLTTDNCKIDWKKSPEEIDRLIRAANPEPGAWCEIQYKAHSTEYIVKRLKILKSHLENGKLILDIVQLEGKKPVSFKQFEVGHLGFEFV